MSRGPGQIERRITELFAADKDRIYSVAEVAAHAYKLNGGTPTRAQRLSATRAAHRVLKRARTAVEHYRTVYRAKVEALGGWPDEDRAASRAMSAALHADPVVAKAEGPYRIVTKTGLDYWRATERADGMIAFHHRGNPVRVWAVEITEAGVAWFEAELVRVTEARVMVRYAGDIAALHRFNLFLHQFAWWRGVRFASERSGATAQMFEEHWEKLFGHAYDLRPAERPMALSAALEMLGMTPGGDFDRDDIIAAFRRQAMKVHPDVGGSDEAFRRLLAARDLLLASIGTSAPAPPKFTPKGYTTRYVSIREPSARRIGQTRRVAHAGR